MPPDVCVVIPAYGDCPHLPSIIAALLAQTRLPSAIVVVHSGASDPSWPLANAHPCVQVHHSEERLLAGAARNLGIDAAEAEWIAFLDADVLPEPSWLESIMAAAESAPRRFVVGSVGYAVSGGYWGRTLWSIEFSSVHPFLPSREMQGGASANMLVRRASLRAVGGFEPGFASGQDTSLTARLREQGEQNWFCAEAIVSHFNLPGLRHCLTHLRREGHWSGICRRLYSVQGSWLARIWPLASALWIARFLLVAHRFLRWGTGRRLLFIAQVPGILLGLLAWTLGFLSGLRPGSESVLSAHEPPRPH